MSDQERFKNRGSVGERALIEYIEILKSNKSLSDYDPCHPYKTKLDV